MRPLRWPSFLFSFFQRGFLRSFVLRISCLVLVDEVYLLRYSRRESIINGGGNASRTKERKKRLPVGEKNVSLSATHFFFFCAKVGLLSVLASLPPTAAAAASRFFFFHLRTRSVRKCRRPSDNQP